MPAPWTVPVAKSVPFDNTDNGFVAEDVQDAIEEARDSVTGRLLYPIAFGKNGVIIDAYLFSFYNISSEDSPVIIPTASEILYVAFANQNAVGDADILVYSVDENIENQTLLHTLNVVGLKTDVCDALSGVNVPAGYGLQVRVTSNSSPNLSNPAVMLYLRAL